VLESSPFALNLLMNLKFPVTLVLLAAVLLCEHQVQGTMAAGSLFAMCVCPATNSVACAPCSQASSEQGRGERRTRQTIM